MLTFLTLKLVSNLALTTVLLQIFLCRKVEVGTFEFLLFRCFELLEHVTVLICITRDMLNNIIKIFGLSSPWPVATSFTRTSVQAQEAASPSTVGTVPDATFQHGFPSDAFPRWMGNDTMGVESRLFESGSMNDSSFLDQLFL